MKTIMQLGLVSMLVMVAAPSYSAEAWHVFTCQMLEEASEKDIVAGASKWLKAARGMKGGEQLELSVHFPMAAEMGENDFLLLLKAPSFEAWGAFWDGYEGSPAHQVDKESDSLTECPDSRLFEGIAIEAK